MYDKLSSRFLSQNRYIWAPSAPSKFNGADLVSLNANDLGMIFAIQRTTYDRYVVHLLRAHLGGRVFARIAWLAEEANQKAKQTRRSIAMEVD
ncbi:hypothetical protein CC1G_09561 [Coprinopsis cinerea okayama7|uniref:Uncharacterized protein n=1 Tax=Coprinopsis cinerea (strain Okayama-7 / 130 / ATCC MYA-4618 / FGSC 9003) TaxID=240176 RepID=A8P963_COPC7|nr:hypothetical protein CC1G_09561 [Coprinopsis cinerea okayama7\|eukprot:XP_001839706.2 hypothetical protein CC1G_09561 [Coprinopsis cinerea okayama7\